ncbi:MAG: DegT/DnrJ/EryC1/StrS family aminotransferase, partial [Promethearchaeota archaeon]
MSEKLAIDGGKKSIPDDFKRKAWPIIDEDDIEAVVNSLRHRKIWGSDAPDVIELEQEWADYCGVKYCRGTNGGTAALHMAIAGVGVQSGDEIIVPAYSFHSTASAIIHHNAIPRFVDIDFETYTIDWRQIEDAITDKTKAIIGVDLFGLPANWDEINKIAKKHGLNTIEDACQSHGAAIRDKKTGTLADIAAFSLNGSKNLPGSEGGFLTSNNSEIMEKAASLEMSVRVINGKRIYPKYSFGWNYRMNPLAAALAKSQLRKLDDLNDLRIKNCRKLTRGIKNLEGIITPKVPEGYKHVYHMYKVALDPGLAEK